MAGERREAFLGDPVTDLDSRRVPLSSRQRGQRRDPYLANGFMPFNPLAAIGRQAFLEFSTGETYAA